MDEGESDANVLCEQASPAIKEALESLEVDDDDGFEDEEGSDD